VRLPALFFSWSLHAFPRGRTPTRTPATVGAADLLQLQHEARVSVCGLDLCHGLDGVPQVLGDVVGVEVVGDGAVARERVVVTRVALDDALARLKREGGWRERASAKPSNKPDGYPERTEPTVQPCRMQGRSQGTQRHYTFTACATRKH
jgi:hypothetical protein